MRKALVALLSVVFLTHFSAAAFAQVDERVIYASVVDAKGQPVLGMGPKDLIVREDGQAREILRVAKDDDPMQIALLVDNSVSMRDNLTDLRRALVAFVSSLRPGPQVALLTLAERPTIVVNYTTDRAALLKGIDRVVAYDAGNYVLDGIAETSEGLAKRPRARSIVVVVTGLGPELSYRHYTDALRPLRDSGAALHAITVAGSRRNSADSAMQTADNVSPGDSNNAVGGLDRDIVLSRMTKETGGRYEELLSMSSLASKLQQLSSEISNQYRVTFARPQRLIPPKSTEISARQPNVRARGMVVKTEN